MIKQLLSGLLILAGAQPSASALVRHRRRTAPAHCLGHLLQAKGTVRPRLDDQQRHREVDGNVTVGSEATLSVSSPAKLTVNGSLVAVNAESI